MTQPDWKPLVGNATVLAQPAGLWTRVVDFVAGPRKLKIVAVAGGKWTIKDGVESGPDGHSDPMLGEPAEVTLFPAVLRGALIGKIGGSAADNPTPRVTAGVETAATGVQAPFPVGSFCVVELSASQKGALFLTMNDLAQNFSKHSGELKVDVFEAL